MSLGTEIKAKVDSVRNTLGTACALNGTGSDKCSFVDLTPQQSQGMLGDDYSDEIAQGWALFGVPSTWTVIEGDVITLTLTGKTWIVRRALTTQVAGVLVEKRCICIQRKK